MPGGRLTHQDRERIGSGLAQGLGYAEIARQLGRPILDERGLLALPEKLRGA